MSTFYVDQRWIAWYLGPRRRSVDLTKVTSVSRTCDGFWSIKSKRPGLRLPGAALAVSEFRTFVALGLAEAQETHRVKMSQKSRSVLELPDSSSSERAVTEPIPALERPPFTAWPGVYSGGNLHWPRREA